MTVSRRRDNAVAKAHRQLYDLPTHYPESRNLQVALGDNLIGLRCLDLGCGIGHWSRLMYSMLAKDVIGVDPDKDCIEAAQTLTRSPYNTIRFLRGSRMVPARSKVGTFDVVVTSAIPTISTFDALRTFFKNVVEVLNTGGRVLALLPDYDFFVRTGLDPPAGLYGLDVVPLRNFEVKSFGLGWSVNLEYSTQPPTKHQAYLLPRGAYERAASEAGLESVTWTKPFVPNEFKQHDTSFKHGFWEEWEARPPFVLFECRKEESGTAGTAELKQLDRLCDMKMEDEGYETIHDDDESDEEAIA